MKKNNDKFKNRRGHRDDFKGSNPSGKPRFKGNDDFKKFSKYNKEKDDEFDGLQLEGRNAVLEAINNDKPIDKIFVKKGEVEGSLKVIIAKASEKGIVIAEIDKTKMEQMKRSHNCQGIIAMCPAHEYCEVSDMLALAKEKGEDPFIIILDEITDPHNLGAIIRTAHCAGVHGVIIPKRRSVGLSAVVSKTSSGAIEYVPVARVTNITRVIQDLQKAGIWIACADMKGTEYFQASLKGPIGIVVGSEGDGVGRLIRETCDFSVKIPMFGKIGSLNASVAAGLVMYEVVRQRIM